MAADHLRRRQQHPPAVNPTAAASPMDERYLERALMQSMTEQEGRIRQEEMDEEEDFVMGLE